MLRKRPAKVVVWLLCLAPAIWLAWRIWKEDLTANPLEYITHFTGDWTIRFIAFTLLITPLRKLLRLPDLIRFRRMLGLYTFFYGCGHFFTYLYLDKLFDLKEMLKDIAKRPFITVGFAALVLMLPLALTSTAGWIRRLGGKRWQLLHRAIYASAVLGVIHYYWLVKSDVRKPLFYGVIVGVLLAYRIAVWVASRSSKPVMRKPVPSTISPA